MNYVKYCSRLISSFLIVGTHKVQYWKFGNEPGGLKRITSFHSQNLLHWRWDHDLEGRRCLWYSYDIHVHASTGLVGGERYWCLGACEMTLSQGWLELDLPHFNLPAGLSGVVDHLRCQCKAVCAFDVDENSTWRWNHHHEILLTDLEDGHSPRLHTNCDLTGTTQSNLANYHWGESDCELFTSSWHLYDYTEG